MGFRTLEISTACEIHIKNGQLEITSDEGIALIPIEDLSQIMVHGANIRMSTMDLSILTQSKVSITTLDEKYLPTAIVLPFEGHARQSKLMHAQVNTSQDKCMKLWLQITKQKIMNQSRALSILGFPGAEIIAGFSTSILPENVDFNESLAAKEYFSAFHEGLNRRSDDPINSQLNAFNLADDLIEPYRAIVDLVAHNNIGSTVILNKNERRELAHVLHNACIVSGTKVNVMTAIDMMCESLKRIVLEKSEEDLLLPTIIPVESMEGITE